MGNNSVRLQLNLGTRLTYTILSRRTTMAPTARLTALASIGIVLFDAVASVVSRSTGLGYGFFAIGSFAIYVLVGNKAYRMTGSLRTATLISVATGFVEGTLGWWVSWLIGPGRPAAGDPSVPAIIAIGTLAAMLFAAFGSQLGARLARRRAGP